MYHFTKTLMLIFFVYLGIGLFLEGKVLQENIPLNFSPKAEVACVLPFIEEDRVLLLQRTHAHPQANLWCAPGGKLISNETPRLAAIRELREETGIEVDPESLIYLGKFYVQYPNGDFIFHLFTTHLLDKQNNIQINNDEHQAYYVCHVNELSMLPLTPGLEECFAIARSAFSSQKF
jgi:8-oxo-dGTP pyrophosphatase MutT (NUDIX family)